MRGLLPIAKSSAKQFSTHHVNMFVRVRESSDDSEEDSEPYRKIRDKELEFA